MYIKIRSLHSNSSTILINVLAIMDAVFHISQLIRFIYKNNDNYNYCNYSSTINYLHICLLSQ
ncbi:hypothetical protein G9C98_000590 [Cotesia typhae]|uniref:Uncharacterized protein n=1 Tax=Cotesia typhae TaxID=2053667 RepID=A0A8J5REW5_9HYME|nr:hypothetical protein G9C98_000590 [Cotesia typhae]